jgi:hypothetical protein
VAILQTDALLQVAEKMCQPAVGQNFRRNSRAPSTAQRRDTAIENALHAIESAYATRKAPSPLGIVSHAFGWDESRVVELHGVRRGQT